MQKLRLHFSLICTLSFLINSFVYAAKSCPGGQFWDTKANRCMLSMNNAEAKQEAAACAGLSGDAFKECFNQNAANRVAEEEASDNMRTHERSFQKGDGAKIAVPLTITLISTYYLFLNKDKFKNCKSTSMYLLFGAGAVSFIGEMSAQITFKKKTKDLADKYKEKMEDYETDNKYSIMTNNQTLAFDYLIEAEEARMSAEKIRKGAYTLATALYAATVAMALVESIQTKFEFGGGCAVKPDKPPKSSTSTTNYSVKDHYRKLAFFDSQYSGYEHMDSMTTLEFMEIIARKVYANLVPVAYAQTADNHEGFIFDEASQSWIKIDENTGGDSNDQTTGTNGSGDANTTGTNGSGDANTTGTNGSGDANTTGTNGSGDANTTGTDGNSGGDNTGDDGNGGTDNATNMLNTLMPMMTGGGGNMFGGGNQDGNNSGNPNITTVFENKHGDIINSPAGKKQMGFLDRALATPYVRGALAALLGAYSLKLTLDAKENIEISENRIEILKQMRDDFVASGGAGLVQCKDSDREDKNKPHCFCYTEDGKYDKKKMQLSMCVALKKEYDLREAKKYGWVHGKMDPVKVCVNEKNEMDTFCKCKGKKSKKGKGNSCAKVSSSFNFQGLGGNSWLNGITAPADSLLNGNLDASQLNTTDLNKKALALQKKIDKMSKDPKYKSNYKKMNDTTLKLQKANKSWYNKSFGNSTPRSLAKMSSGASSTPSSLKEVVKQAKKEMKSSKTVTYDKAGTAGGAAAKKNDSLDFDWGSDSSAAGGVKIEEIAKVMDKNYAIKGDINKNPNHDIFKILSNRYQRSGLRRLFDVDGTSKADEANGSDINEK